MAFYVYILENKTTGIYYKGFTEDYLQREWQHNNNESRFTSNKGSWKLVYVEACATKTEALIREKKLKHSNKDYLRWLITQPINILLLK